MLYNSPRLVMLVKRWANNKRIKEKDYVDKTMKFLNELKDFTKTLASEENLDFNKESIFAILDLFYKN